MEILRTIVFYTKDKDMPFLIIGGQAINHYKISRQTGDIDFLVPLKDKTKWQALLKDLSYNEFQSTNNFSRFEYQGYAAWPIDLMYVNDETFIQLNKDSVYGDFGLVQAKVISTEHLIILKIHSLKVFQDYRYAKDYSDLINLLKLYPINQDNLMQYCEKYASINLYKKLQNDLKLS